MGNYPYATNLFGQGLKAWPLKSACEQKGLNALEFLAKAVGSYYNATGAPSGSKMIVVGAPFLQMLSEI